MGMLDDIKQQASKAVQNPQIEEQIKQLAAKENISLEEAKKRLMGEK